MPDLKTSNLKTKVTQDRKGDEKAQIAKKKKVLRMFYLHGLDENLNFKSCSFHVGSRIKMWIQSISTFIGNI